ncbi:MAG TPA: 1-phosphofructokinase family hexose kinase [Rhizomicrobium sp.]|nr:1-phosphofructokinase family hexose kinase [Rhizomicrobium sp.]
MRKRPILTLTMNPAVDVSSSIPALEPFEKLRCEDVWHHPGGGGINVSRVIERLGAETIAVFPCGGAMGMLLKHLLADEGVRHLPVAISGDTREDFSISETATGKQFRFILPGPVLSQAEIRKCLDTIVSRLRPGSFLVASGSLPPGAPVDFYAELAEITVSAGARLVLDTSGAPLRAAVDRGGLFLIKPSQSELNELAGKPASNEEARIRAARQIVSSRRVEFVCVSLGADGALLVGGGCVLKARAPRVDVKTTIGAGDSFLAALVWAFARRATPSEALRIAVAAGTAALLAPGTGLCTLADMQALKAQIHVEQLELAQ